MSTQFDNFPASSDIIRYLNSNMKLSLSKIAKAMGVQKAFVSKVLHGTRTLSMRRVEMLAESLNMPLIILLLKSLESRSVRQSSRSRYASLCEMMEQALDLDATDSQQ